MKMKFILLIAMLAQIFSFGCATATGPLFKEDTVEEHNGKAIVYFYRNSQAGGASVLDLKINRKATFPLLNKGYHLLVLEPGEYEFEVLFNSKILKAENKFVLKGNETYYIRYRADVVGHNPGLVTSGPIFKDSITLVPREDALEVIKKCRLIEVPRKPQNL